MVHGARESYFFSVRFNELIKKNPLNRAPKKERSENPKKYKNPDEHTQKKARRPPERCVDIPILPTSLFMECPKEYISGQRSKTIRRRRVQAICYWTTYSFSFEMPKNLLYENKKMHSSISICRSPHRRVHILPYSNDS